jgi:WD40 repeat protein/DNA-binding CsgD family transcriptional regulator/tRNA A-37 threonylcarbamoyl transferase component Bud32
VETLTNQAIKGYALHDCIGQGAFGAVYRAYQALIDREVAIKVILPQYANQPDFVRRFETEAQLVARLEHIHIVPLYDYWRDPTGAYLVMRYLRGGNLKDWLAGGPLDPGDALRVLDQLAGALALAHRRGIIHRDIKPTNILLDEEHNAFLADFGFAKVLGGESSQEAVRGTPQYISPEQIRGEPVNPQSDLYSLGLVLFEMLTGRPAFQPTSPAEMVYQHLESPVPDITTDRRDLPAPVNEVIQTATAKTPADRYPDTLGLARALREALAAAPAIPVEVAAPLVEPLTNRELDVLRLMAQGWSNREIAEQLVIALSTVKWYVRQVYGKLGVSKRRQAIVAGEQLGLLAGAEAARHDIALPTWMIGENPYKGLAAFQQADAADFFGRAALVAHLISCLQADGDLYRFLAVVGPSGSGKSSVVRAGLLPALAKGAVPGSEGWFVVDMLPGARPLDKLEVTLGRIAIQHLPGMMEQLQRDAHGLGRVVDLVLPDDGELLLVIDQFEELFTLVENPATARHFLSLIHAAVSDPRGRVRVIITLRADFFDRPLVYPDFYEIMRHRTEIVGPLTAEELEATIVKPAENAGVVVESSLVSALVAEVSEQPGTLPLLEYALTELFDRREGRTMTLAAYHDLGGALGALARRADDLYGDLAQVEREAARQLFLRLITLGEGTEDVRRRVLRAELEAVDVERDVMEDVIDAFGEDRLLTFDFDPTTRESTVEVAHEALIQRWGRLREWLDESRQDVRLQRLLTTAAQEWITHGRDMGFVLQRARLAQFEDWVAKTDLALTDDEREFLHVSIAEHARQRARRRRTRNLTLVTAIIVAVIMAALALYGLGEADQSQAARATSEAHLAQAWDTQARFLADLSRQQAAIGDKRRAVLLAMEGLAHYDEGIFHPENHQSLLDALAQPGMEQLFLLHDAPVNGAVWNANETRLLTWSEDGTARVWDAVTGAPLLTLHHADSVLGAAWNRAETRILTWSNDGTARVWDADGNPLFSLLHTDTVRGAIWNRDETRFLTWSSNNTARVWDAVTGAVLLTLDHDDHVRGAVWNRDETRLLTWSNDARARVWDATSGAEHLVLEHDGPVWGAAWNRDETQILTWSWDNAARVWNVADGSLLLTLQHADSVAGARWNADETRILTWSWDDTAQVWDATSSEVLALPLRHSGNVHGAVWNGDETRILTWSDDAFARVWDARRGSALLTLPHAGPVMGATWNADETQILTWAWDNTARVWDGETGSMLFTVRHDDSIHDLMGAAWSADGTTLLTWAGDTTARTWNAARGEASVTVRHADLVEGAAFNPDGTRLLTWSQDGTAWVWDVVSGASLLTLAHTDPVNGATWNNDGTRILTWADVNALVWDASSGRMLSMVTFSEDGPIAKAEWNHDETHILASVGTWGGTGSVQIRDAATGNVLAQSSPMGGDDPDWNTQGTRWLDTVQRDVHIRDQNGSFLLTLGHAETIAGAAWSNDDRRILTWGVKDAAFVWNVTKGENLHTLHHGKTLLGAAWSAQDKRILTWSEHMAQVWDADTGATLLVLDIPGTINGMAWSQDGKQLLAWVQNRISIWDAASGELILSLPHTNTVEGAAWGQATERILIWSGNTVQVWITDLDKLIERAAQLQIRPLTDDERARFFLP